MHVLFVYYHCFWILYSKCLPLELSDVASTPYIHKSSDGDTYYIQVTLPVNLPLLFLL